MDELHQGDSRLLWNDSMLPQVHQNQKTVIVSFKECGCIKISLSSIQSVDNSFSVKWSRVGTHESWRSDADKQHRNHNLFQCDAIQKVNDEIAPKKLCD